MGVCITCGDLDSATALAVPTAECARHPLNQAHSPMPSRHGTMVYVTCGGCGVRGVTTAGRWQAALARRHGAGATVPEEG
jgi:hypothetical protein